MFVQIDPTVPLVWRGHDSAQAGIDPARVRLDAIDDLTARALSELVKGTSTQKLSALLGAERSARLREQLRPVLGIRPSVPLPRVAVIGRSSAVGGLADQIAQACSTVVRAAESVDVDPIAVDAVVLVSDFVVSPMDVQPWLGGDIEHLTVVFTESSAIVGPLVRPGESACVSCVELDRMDHDSAWSAIAPQVWMRQARPSAALVAHAAAEVLSVMASGCGYSTRIDSETFSRVVHPHTMHPACGCQSLPALPE